MFPFFRIPPDASLGDRLGLLVTAVLRFVGDRTRLTPSAWGPQRPLMSVPAVYRIQVWLRTRQQRMRAIIARIAAGTQRAPRPYAPRAVVAPDAVRAPRKVVPLEERLPRGFGWVREIAHGIGPYVEGLSLLLNEAEMRAMVIATPQLVRHWVPLLNALGEPTPDWMPRLARPGRPSRTRDDAARSARAGLSRQRERRRQEAPPTPTPPPPPPPIPAPKIAPWTGRGPGPCATLAEYRSPFEPPGADHPPMPPAPDRQGDLPILRRGW